MGECGSPRPGAAQALPVSPGAVRARRSGARNWGAPGAGPGAGTRLWTLGHWAGVPSVATMGWDQGRETWDHSKAELEPTTGILSWSSSARRSLGASWTSYSPSKPALCTLSCSLLNPSARLISTAEAAPHSVVRHRWKSASHRFKPDPALQRSLNPLL